MRLLESYLAEYLVDRPACAKYRGALYSTVRAFGAHLGRPARMSDLQPRRVNEFLSSLLSAAGSRSTARGKRARLLSIWRHAFERDRVAAPPMKIMRVVVPEQSVEAWGESELRRLLDACDALHGAFRNRWALPRRDVARALILTAYDSGARLGDIERWTRDVLAADGSLCWVQSKSGKVQTAALYPETVDALRKIISAKRRTIFGGLLSRRYFFRFFRALVEAAGLRGTFRWLRRSGGSLVERDHPGWGHRHCGNTPGVFRRHYDARRLTADHFRRPRPPRIARGA